MKKISINLLKKMYFFTRNVVIFFNTDYDERVRGVAQPGSALAWGARGRRFKSFRPDHIQQGFNEILIFIKSQVDPKLF